MRTTDFAGTGKKKLKKQCAERLEFFLRLAADRYFCSRKILVEFRVEHDEEMMFLAVWRGEPTEKGWCEYPAFGLSFNHHMSCWTVYEWGERAQFWDECDLPYYYDTLDDAYDAARKRGLLFARPDYKGEGARA